MSKRTRRRKPPTSPRRRPSPRNVPDRGERREPDLIDEVQAAMTTGEPLELLALASAFLEAVDPGRRSPLARPHQDPELPGRQEIVETFFEVPLRETSALLTALAVLTGDDVLRSRVRREVAAREHVLPRWLVELDTVQPHDVAVEMKEVLGDGENLALGVSLAGGHELTMVVYVDHNLGTLVKDAFVVPGALSAVEERMREAADADVTVAELAPADARARITEAIERGAITFPPLETESWPACRPLLEWALRMLPADGHGYEHPEWTDGDRQALAERVLASPFGAGLHEADRRDLLDMLLWFGTEYGPGDPLRWSPVAVEILLADWIPRKIGAEVRYLSKAPEVLRALIRFAHAERGVRPGLTEETLDAVDAWEPEYQRTIRSPRLQGPEALLASIGALEPDEYFMRQELERAVGEAVDDFDTAPLPDEPFAWERVPDDVRDRVAEVLPLTDGCCDQLLDVEHRTAARRLLAAAAEGDPAVFRRRSRPETTAAAVCWLVAKANRRFDSGDLAVKDLMAYFGPRTTSASQRASVILGAIGLNPHAAGDKDLRSARYLTAARRRQLAELREELGELDS